MAKKGNYGKVFNERERSAEVRNLALERVRQVLIRGKGKFYEAILIRLAGTLLPRLNELTGENGGPLIIELPSSIIKKNGLHTRTGNNR